MDRQTKRATEQRIVTVTEVDMANSRINVTDNYSQTLYVSLNFLDPLTSIPATGERWIVERMGNEWYLGRRADIGGVPLTAALHPGDRRLDAGAGTLYLSGGIIDFTAASIVGLPSVATPTTQSGLLAGRPLANNTLAGSFYYATDQAVLHLSDGATWQRMGLPAGATTMYFGTSAPTGWVIYDGSNLPASTGIYADLASHLGGVMMPDTRGRMLVAKGTHADVSGLGNNDGQPVANRRPKHRTSNSLGTVDTIGLNDPGHAHGEQTDAGVPSSGNNVSRSSNFQGTAVPNNTTTNTTGITKTGTVTLNGSIGTNDANDNLDAPSYIVFTHIAKL